MSDTKAPSMNRSRGQLATVYAPGSLFTFEGGTGACIACSLPNRPYEPIGGAGTKRMIYEQIVEFIEAWVHRAMAGQRTVVPVTLERTIDRAALRDGAVHLPIGLVHFQVPELVGYLPFPCAFACTRCGLYRHSEDGAGVAEAAAKFRNDCPRGRDACADDWQQLDVVMAHWSGAVEALSPTRRRVDPNTLAVEHINKCSTCGEARFYLRRIGSTFARWQFECVECAAPREILLADRTTLEILKRDLIGGADVLAQINMEPVSYRASAVFYPQGDRLLVFGDDHWIALLNGANSSPLGQFLAGQYGFPPPALDDAEKERLLRDAGLGTEWDEHVQGREMLRSSEGKVPEQAIAFLRRKLAEDESSWNKTVFSARAAAPGTLAAALTARPRFIRRFDPIRMAVEHRTLLAERLRSVATLADGRQVAVDVTRPDDFMVPDTATDTVARQALIKEVERRLILLGIAEMRLLRGLQVCEYTFGFTRTSSMPLVRREKAGAAEMPVRLNLFGRIRVGDVNQHPVLCLEQANEAFYVRLDEATVLDWLTRNRMPQAAGHPRLGGRLIESYPPLQFTRFLDEFRRERSFPRVAYPFVYTLLHTMAHHLVGTAASMSGLDLGSFGEHIFVPDLAFLVYRRGMTIDLGNLSSMWRDRGDPAIGNEVLDRMVSPESLRCGSESVCTHHGGACPDCILIPETACLTRNELLARSVLAGRGTPRWDADGRALVGYYEVATDRSRMAPL